jgi:hypothetical protein
MEKITLKDISVTNHAVDGFTLSYLCDDSRYYHQRYIGYTVREAKRRFKDWLIEQLVQERVLTNISIDDLKALKGPRFTMEQWTEDRITLARELLGVG